DLQAVVDQARRDFRGIIANFPDRMTFLDVDDIDSNGKPREKAGRIIVAGGEILLEPVRESVLYPGLDLFHQKYQDVGGVQLIVQTTGDLVTPKIVAELLEHHVETISVSGLDSFHAGLEQESAREALKDKLRRIFESFGMTEYTVGPAQIRRESGQRYYSFWGATPDSWIGKLWPRGRAHQNELSTAGLTDNFCNGWSGGLNFLQRGLSGSEVSIDPTGN